MSCTKGALVVVGGTTSFDTITAVLQSVDILATPPTATLLVNGITYTIQEGSYQKFPFGKVGVFAITRLAACIDVQELVTSGRLSAGYAGMGETPLPPINLGNSTWITSVDQGIGGCGGLIGAGPPIWKYVGSDDGKSWYDLSLPGTTTWINLATVENFGTACNWDFWVYTGAGGSPSPSPTPTPPPAGTLPPPPTLTDCLAAPLPGWNVWDWFNYSINFMKCELGNMLLEVQWVVSFLGTVDQMFLDLQKAVLDGIASALTPISDLITGGITDIRNDISAAATDISTIVTWVEGFAWPDFAGLINTGIADLWADVQTILAWTQNPPWGDLTKFFDSFIAAPLHNWFYAELGLDPTLDFWTAVETRVYNLIVNILTAIINAILPDFRT
jgi:hypothetical protein